MSDFFRYLKKHKKAELLKMQQKQLFRDSVGADGVSLGKYEGPNRQAGSGIIRRKGEPFWMDNTGQLFNRMKVNVLVGVQEIVFENDRHEIDKPWFRFNEDIYATDEWFGLTEEHMDVVREWARVFSGIWAYNMIHYGTRTTHGQII